MEEESEEYRKIGNEKVKKEKLLTGRNVSVKKKERKKGRKKEERKKK